MMASAPPPGDFPPTESTVENPDLILVETTPKANFGPLATFFGVLGVIALLNLILAIVRVPVSLALPLSLAVTVVMVATPILALYKASSVNWTLKLSFLVFAAGVLCHIGLITLALRLHFPPNLEIIRAALRILSQAGLLTWCLGLGALVSQIIREKNFLLPVAIFLAAFDVFLVLTPIGPTQHLMKAHREVFENLAYAVPTVQHVELPTTVAVRPFAYIGPADFLFLATYFIALFKFRMRTAETFKWLVPTLIGYLAIVIFGAGVHIGPISLEALPALLPIGTVLLVVNRKEWQLNQEEKLSTALISLLALGLVAYGMTRKSPPPLPEPPPAAPNPAGHP